MKIGDLAAATGLSLRTIRHYDEIGLLTPSDRTDSNHRVYSREDLSRLQNILYLKQMGLSLSEIRGALERPNSSLEIIERRISQIEGEVEDLRTSLKSLYESRSILTSGHNLSTEKLIENLKGAAMFEKYFTKDQRDELKQRADSLGSEAMEEASRKWSDVIARVRSAIDRGVSPASAEAKSLAAEWSALVNAFAGGNQQIEANASKMYAENPDAAARYGMDKDMFQFIKSARG